MKPKGKLVNFFVFQADDEAQRVASWWRSRREADGTRYTVRVYRRCVRADGHDEAVAAVVIREASSC